MLLSFFIWLVFVLTFLIFVYGMLLMISACFAFVGKTNTELLPVNIQASVDILIPCYNEGSELVDTVLSLRDQDYKYQKNIILLFNDKDDDSLPFVKKSFGVGDGSIDLSSTTRLTIVFTGLQQKRDKLNSFLTKASSPYTAFLDADHVATSSWISQSLSLLVQSDDAVCAVQSRRAPKNKNQFFQMWDSAQNHVGNEMLNIFLSRKKGSVFFTGTTAVFKSETFENHQFSQSITEDTFLSYDLLLEGKRILYNPVVGSHESVSPTLSDYIARRRRWASGHTQTFFTHVKSLLFSKEIKMNQKLLMTAHGVFYLIPVLAVFLVNIFQGFTFLQFTSKLQIISFVLALALTVLLNGFLVRGYALLRDTLVAFLWVFPFAIGLVLSFSWLLNFEFYHFINNFPYLNGALGIVQLVAVLIPLLILLLSNLKLRAFPFFQSLLLILSYPLVIFFDIYAALLGFSDFCFKSSRWKKISRKSPYIFSKGKVLIVLTLVALLLAGTKFNIFSDNYCGKQKNHFLYAANLLLGTAYRLDVDLNISKEDDSGLARFVFSGSVDPVPSEGLVLIFDDEPVPVVIEVDGSFSKTLKLPVGFESLHTSVEIQDSSCREEISFTNTVKEIRGSEIFINGEPFLVKGVVPSFSQSQLEVSHQEGLAQIKVLGGNLIRTYHNPSESIVDEASKLGLMLIPQPALSNWGNTDFHLRGSRGLLRRYKKLHDRFYKNPYLLMLNLGNEIEIEDPTKIQTITDMLSHINDKELGSFSTYSSFYPAINYPSDILGVNMLDTGLTYWEKSIPIVTTYNKPFIASELGGFEAFFEKTDPIVRAIRLRDYWETLLSYGGSGAVMFQSHDNWAQPIPVGYNNPFTPEQPDDQRGLWDKENKEKPIANTVEALFADIEVEYSENLFNAEQITLKLRNKRRYKLKNIKLFVNGRATEESFSLDVGAIKEVTLPAKVFTSAGTLHVEYISHAGLSGFQSLHAPILYPKPQPFFHHQGDIILKEKSENIIVAVPLVDDLELILPEGWSVEGQRLNTNKFVSIKNQDPFFDLDVVSVLANKTSQASLPSSSQVGHYSISLSSDKPLKDQQLVLEGTGSSQISLILGTEVAVIDIHPYRENFISLGDYITSDPINSLEVTFVRENHIYLDAEQSPAGETIHIDMQVPKVFEPQNILIKQAK